MKTKRVIAAVLGIALLFCVCFAQFAYASVFTFETQYDYTVADPAWLTDLVIKEDLTDVSAVAGRCTLIAAPEYPYTETPASFKKEVDQFCSLYSIDENTFKVSFLYFIQLLGSNSSLFAAQASDAEVKAYLQNAGVAYPADASPEMNVLAKALYTAMITGAFSGVSGTDGAAGVELERALTSFIVKVSGFQESELQSWVPGGSLNTVDDYVVAVARLTLWSNGYDVTVDTPEDEAYRLLAVMAIRNMGVSVDADASFSELQSKYTAAMLGKKYGVTVDPVSLANAASAGSEAFYILQLIGQKNGLTVRTENGTYEEAFEFVASHTDLFDIEEGEFYADIYKYDIYLTAPRSSLWIYPTSHFGGTDPSAVRIVCNGILLKDNYFTQVAISAAEKLQTLAITVNCTAEGGSVKEYVINVHAEDALEQAEQPTEQAPTANESKTVLNSNAIVTGILNSIGVDPGIVEATGNLIGALPQSVQGVMRFISPTFEENTESQPSAEQPGIALSNENAQRFISVLDSIGAFVNSSIGGINGLGLSNGFSEGAFNFNLISFN